MSNLRALCGRLTAFWRSRSANVAIIFGLSIVPITIAAGAGLDFARGLMVRARIAQALDAAGLAVGGASKAGMSQSQLQTLAQQYFNANYVEDHSFGTPASVSVVVAPDGKSATLSTSINVPTVLVKVGDLIGCTHCDTMAIPVTNTIVWGQTKLWVSLVLDNTLSMCEPDSMPCSSDTSSSIKINALKTATHQLLTILQGAATNAGDVRVAIVPFSKDVNVGTSNASATWIDWTDWDAAPANAASALTSSMGAGSACPWSTSSQGYTCQAGPSNGSSTVTTIPSTCTINGTSRNGCICPTGDNGSHNSGRLYHYYNGCYDSQPTTTTTTIWSCTGSTCSCGTRTSCTCSGSGSSKVCRQTQTTTGAPYTHTWYTNAHSTWTGCVEDRTQNYDVQNTTPSGSSNFPAENMQPIFSGLAGCLPATVGTLSYDWTSLSNQVDAMIPSATTNQTIGLVWGWQALSTGAPLNAPTLPADTQRYIILVSDGLNTQDRWYGDGSHQSSSVDSRMSQVCTNVKADNIVVYTIFVDLNGTQGNSTVLQNCASDSSKYFDLTTTGAIITTLNSIAQDIVHLRVAR